MISNENLINFSGYGTKKVSILKRQHQSLKMCG